MQEKDKHKLYSKEELLKLMKEGKDAPADMDDFDREALEGLKLVNNEDVLDKLNDEVDRIVEEEKRKKKTVYYFSAAASLLLLIGLVFLFKNSVVNKDEKPLALVEKNKEESVNGPSALKQTETQPLPDKEPEYKEEEKSQATNVSKGKAEKQAEALYEQERVTTKAAKDEQTGKDQHHESPVVEAKVTREQADEANKLSDVTKPLSKNDISTATGTSANQGPPNKQEEQTIAANETITNSNAAVNGGATYSEKAKEKKTNAKNSQQPSQIVAGLSLSDNANQQASTPVEQKIVREDNQKSAAFYAKDADKSAAYQAPTFISGDSAFANYAKQNLKISSPGNSGIITVSFVVTKNGTANNIEVTRPISNCASCSDDVINLIKSIKKWQPAIRDGKAIDATKKINIQYN